MGSSKNYNLCPSLREGLRERKQKKTIFGTAHKLILVFSILLFSCKTEKVIPTETFQIKTLPLQPDYSQISSWAALPTTTNVCNQFPANYKDACSKPATIDVFFVYPTIYNDGKNWNADIHDEKLDKVIQESTLKNQASVFYGLADIYAPYYRQMHYNGYFNPDTSSAWRAFDTAYADVKRAFEYYLKHFNHNRSFIIAAHSQGTNHAERLIREVILPDTNLRKQLFLAYLVGMPVQSNFNGFPPCLAEEDIDCFLSWRTFGDGFVPAERGGNIFAINPITFNAQENVNHLEQHQGILFKNFRIMGRHSLKVESKDGYVEVEEIHIPILKHFFKWKNYHIADYNMFWINIRENLKKRMAQYPIPQVEPLKNEFK